jgi:hypothetical protein
MYYSTFAYVAVGSSVNNLTQMLMQTLMNQGGLTNDMIVKS